MELYAKLNTQQKQAATAQSGHNLIIASAGTGKTSTIVGRIAYLLKNGISPSEILLLTFTNKASEEMIERVGNFCGKEIAKEIQAGTFHAVAYRYLKSKYNIMLKQPKELKMLLRSVYDERVFLHRDMLAPYSSQHLYDMHCLYLNSSTEKSFGEYILDKNAQHEMHIDVYQSVIDEFGVLKKEYGYVDYNDLLILYRDDVKTQNINYKEVLCDEYQDTNPLQDSIIKALDPKSLFCVGDYDQSIYAFNGADISIISDFTTKYPNAKVFTLTKNYRSSSHILDLANKVISKNPRIYPKQLEVIKQGNFSYPKLITYEDVFAQYQGIAQKIRESGKNPKNIAVIFRNNSSGDGIEASLREARIPSKRKGGNSFFDAKEVALMLDICACFHNTKDMMAYIHILSYGKGIGACIAKDIYEALVVLGEKNILDGLYQPKASAKIYKKRKSTQEGLFDDFFRLENSSRFDKSISRDFASHPILAHPKLTSEGAKFLDDFYLLFSQKIKNPSKLIEHISNHIFFKTIINDLAIQRSKNKDGSVDENRKEESLQKIGLKMDILKNLGGHYESVGHFLNAMVLGGSEASEGDGVNLLSIHASKGLEFDDVYIIDLMDTRFPNTKLISKGGSLEEERRLFYVAVTRAKENLFLSYAKRDSQKNTSYAPSTFLCEANLIR